MKDKVTIEDVRAAIDSISFVRLGAKTTVAMAILKNGFEIVESSSCVNPDNYSAEIGEKLCRQRIEDKIWAFLGFQLQAELAGTRLSLQEGVPLMPITFTNGATVELVDEAANG